MRIAKGRAGWTKTSKGGRWTSGARHTGFGHPFLCEPPMPIIVKYDNVHCYICYPCLKQWVFKIFGYSVYIQILHRKLIQYSTTDNSILYYILNNCTEIWIRTLRMFLYTCKIIECTALRQSSTRARGRGRRTCRLRGVCRAGASAAPYRSTRGNADAPLGAPRVFAESLSRPLPASSTHVGWGKSWDGRAVWTERPREQVELQAHPSDTQLSADNCAVRPNEAFRYQWYFKIICRDRYICDLSRPIPDAILFKWHFKMVIIIW